MDNLEELGLEVARLKVIEENIINEMRNFKTPYEKLELLCKLEVVRYDITNICTEYRVLLRNKEEPING